MTTSRLRIIDINDLEKLPEQAGSYSNAFKDGYNNAIEFLLKKLSDPSKTKEILSEVYKEGHCDQEYNLTLRDNFINNLIKE